MDLARHYFTSDDLDDLESVEVELEKAGISTPQIHVLSRDNAEVQRHPRLHGVPSFMKRDMVHSAAIGAFIGFALACISLLLAYMLNWTSTPAGWVPFVFLAVVLFGFFAWLGGLYGLQVPNHHFARFDAILDEGKHVFFVDLDYTQEGVFNKIVKSHPRLHSAGLGESKNQWLVKFERSTAHWWYWRMWRNA